MMLGVRRETEHEDVGYHLLDPKTGRGMLFLYDTESEKLQAIRRHDVTNMGKQEMEDYLVGGPYFPREIPDTEFNGLYEKVLSRSLFEHDFNPSEIPAVISLVKESKAAFFAAYASALIEASRKSLH